MIRFAQRRLSSMSFAMAGVLVFLWHAESGLGAEKLLHRVTFTDVSKEVRTVEGQVLVEAQDGGLLLIGRDGQLHNVTPDQLRKNELTQEPFRPYNHKELGQQLQAELGAEFQVIATRNYVLCTNAGRAYANWCGALFERLLASFRTHWQRAKLETRDPEFPLVALIFATQQEFARYATADAGPATAESKGYYSIRTNRIALYDLTAGPDGRPAATLAEVNRRTAQASFNIATVIHEATHQIAFNCGLHTRYADNPVWLTEGMAMYFEVPDLRSRTGWQTVGKVNQLRYRGFLDYAAKDRTANSLSLLLASDDRFRDAAAEDAYAEAWALTYFLIKTRREQYVDYLKRVSRKPRLIWDSPEKRLEEFRAAFGQSPDELDREFLKYVSRLK